MTLDRMIYLLDRVHDRLDDGKYIDGDFIEQENLTVDETNELWSLLDTQTLSLLIQLKLNKK